MRNSSTFSVRSVKVMGLATASALALSGGQAFAQDDGASESDADDNPVIIVTARKREETLLEVPLAISAFSQEQIADRGITTVADISAYTPGFDFQEVGQGGASGRDNPNIRFRGVSVQNENPASRAGAVFWEGAYLSAGAGLLPTFDIQRVEVIKGPQNAFFGRNTFSGAVNFIPAEPGDDLEGFVNLLYSPSDQDTYEVTGGLTIPMGEKFGARLAAQYRRAGADFQFDDGNPLGKEETLSLQGTLMFDNDAGLKIKTTGFYVDANDTRAVTSLDFTNAPGECDLTYSGELRDVATGEISGSFSTDLSTSAFGTFCGEVPDWDENGFNVPAWGAFDGGFDPSTDLAFGSALPSYYQTLPSEIAGFSIPSAPDGIGNEYNVWRVNKSVEYETESGFTISALGSYGESGSWRLADQLYGQRVADQIRLTAFVFYNEDLYGQIRFASPDEGRIRYQAGFSYFDSSTRIAEFSFFAGAAFLAPGLDDHALNFTDSKAYGLFGSVDFDITDALTLSVEGRYTKDKLTTVYNGPSLDNFTVGDYVLDPIVDAEQSFSKFMPRILLSYNPTDNLNIYGSWAISYLQGSDTNVNDYAAVVPGAGLNIDNVGIFTPVQKLTAYEIGVKAQPSSTLSFAIAAYYMDWKNQVQFELSSPATGFTPLFTAGDSEYTGVEAEARWSPTPWLQLEGNISWVDAEFVDFAGTGSVARVLNPGLADGTQISSIGLSPRYIPEWTGAIGVNFSLDELFQLERDVFLRFDGTYFGDFFIDNFEYNQVNGSWKWNARLGAEVSDGVRVDFYALNLLDDLSFTPSGGTTTGIADPGGFPTRKVFGTLPRARELGIELNFSF